VKERTKLANALTYSVLVLVLWFSGQGCDKHEVSRPAVILSPENATVQERLAAREIMRYMYLCTGQLLKIVQSQDNLSDKHGIIIVARKDRTVLRYLGNSELTSALDTLGPEQYILRSLRFRNRDTVIISGGDEIGTLYGAYRFAELLGVRFYLHGDVIPDERIAFSIPADLDEEGKPLFDTRGIQPFHDFPEGPDWWNVDDYKAILSQLPKLRMNFFGLHTYPEGEVGPEPTAWIGLADDFNEDGTVIFSYPSRYFTTLEGDDVYPRGWGYTAKKTSEFIFGAHKLFEHDAYSSDVMLGYSPLPETLEDCNEVFNRVGVLLNDAFNHAHILGIKTCLGTETPLKIPTLLKERLKKKGNNPDDLSVVEKLYEGIFSRIKKTYDIDYYWFWTPESWIWGGNTEDDIIATKNDLLAAVKAAKNVNAPFTLATCGWVLGPQSDRSMFDNILPRDMPLSCINRFLGMSPVDHAFYTIKNRPKWAIPWMEDDPALTSPQLWAGRMRADAVDALKYGCTGLIGIHWRTRILGPTVSALARAAWDQNTFGEKPLVSGPIGENISEFTARWTPGKDESIKNTKDDTLYRTLRHELSQYRLEIPDGKYTVTLKFCEHQHEKENMRVFGVKIQDETVLNDLDIFATAGRYTALDYSFENIPVTDGWLIIEFIRKFDYPAIAALVVEGDDYSLKINCGGPDYKDYKADYEKVQPRDRETDDFFDDWALSQFGPEEADEISRLFQAIDGRLPRPSRWILGPGSLYPDMREWKEVMEDYAFVGDFERLRNHIKGAGNCERFDYWLNKFFYMRAAARLNCAWGKFEAAMEKVNAENESKSKSNLAKETALPLYKELVKLTGEVYRFLLATVSTNGEIGTVANLDQHTMPRLLGETGKKLSKALGEELPDDTIPSKNYSGEPRVIVPTVRTIAMEGEVLTLKVIFLDTDPFKQAKLFWRSMSKGKFKSEPLKHINRGVYSVQFPPDGMKGEALEYYLKIVTDKDKKIYFPSTAPETNHTIVILSP